MKPSRSCTIRVDGELAGPLSPNPWYSTASGMLCQFPNCGSLPLISMLAVQRMFSTHGISTSVACGSLHKLVWSYLGGAQMIVGQEISQAIERVAADVLQLRKCRLRMRWTVFCKLKFGHQSASIFSRIERKWAMRFMTEEFHCVTEEVPREGPWFHELFMCDVCIYAATDQDIAAAVKLFGRSHRPN